MAGNITKSYCKHYPVYEMIHKLQNIMNWDDIYKCWDVCSQTPN